MSLILSPQARDNVAGLIMNLLTKYSQINETTHSEGRFTLPRIVNSEAGPLHLQSMMEKNKTPNNLFNRVLLIPPAGDLN